MKFASKLPLHPTGMLNDFDHLISTRLVEGINNKIKVLRRIAYNFRNIEYFKLRVYSNNGARYALI